MSTINKQKINFTTISNKMLNDKELSLKAKGLFAFMFSKPDDWNFTIKSMSSQLKEGVDSIKATLSELKEFGYIQYQKHKNGHGTYHLHYEPMRMKPKVENPCVEKPKSGKPTRISNKEPLAKKIFKEEEEDYKNFIYDLRDKYIGVKFDVGRTSFYMGTDGYLKVYETNKRVSAGRAIDIYKRLYKRWDEFKPFFISEAKRINKQ